ncbi:heat shock protein 70 B2-like [Paramacrobiotus metropolitanus]|uniref:heat shock protein 70 B2-like n=1 Tax=Paramacrobiotus metropolitanus TaxID=2943436 RepID=UPI002446013B|nr:heat shock protein 70 B2-like [Paramacrobiotus metropolitanus]
MADGVGIDLGTTHCCLFVYKHGRSPQVIKNKAGDNTTPSWVRYEQDGLDVGKHAKRQSPENSRNTIRNAKRLIGRSFQDPAVESERRLMPFKIVNNKGSPAIEVDQCSEAGDVIWKRTLRPEEVSAVMLSSLKEMAEGFLGRKVIKAVVTIPANFMETQRAATLSAARLAGLTEVTLLNEPTAAAIAYGGVMDEQCTILVFDFGGGTLDISIMKVEGRNEYRVLSTDGDMYLGGENFDNEIVQYFLDDIRSKHRVNLAADAKAKAVLKLIAEDAKIALSSPHTHKYKETVYTLHDDFKYEAVLTKKTFNGMFRGLLQSILVPVKNALEAADLLASDIDKVILVGGSSKLPAVKETLEGFFGPNVVCGDANPDEAIARGAAMQSYRFNNSQSSNVQEITAYHYGIEIRDRSQPGNTRIAELIPRGKPYPCSQTDIFVTADDNQTVASFNVYQSKRGFSLDKFRIGQFNIAELPPRRAGECKFDVTYNIDRSNILHAAAQGKGDISSYKKNIDIRLDNVV